MRTLLINPFYPISETPSPPLGLAFLAAALEQAGVEVRILDFVVIPYSRTRLESVLGEFRPHMVGITSVTMTVDHALTLVKQVKRADPHMVTVMGGPHVSFRAQATMEACPELDIIVTGEGEKTLVDLARAVEKGTPWAGVLGLVYRDRTGIRSSGTRGDPVDLNALPLPARHLLPLGRYKALGMPITMTTSRGCPFKCIFCVGGKMLGPRVRYRNPESVADEMESLVRLGFPQINIADDLFTANQTRCISVCDEIIRRELNTGWACFARVDTVSSQALSKMKEAGCHTISFGVETADPDILRVIRKGITLDQVISAVNMCVEAGIAPHASFILGLPGETQQTLEGTAGFARRLKDMGASYGFHVLAPFPGTEVREERGKFKIKILTHDWSQYHANRAVAETPGACKKELDRLVIEWEDKFNEWLGLCKDHVERGTATEEEARQIKGLEHTVRMHELMMRNTLEEKGTWQDKTGGCSAEAALRELASRLQGADPPDYDRLMASLKTALEQGTLRLARNNGRVRWEWVEFLVSPPDLKAITPLWGLKP